LSLQQPCLLFKASRKASQFAFSNSAHASKITLHHMSYISRTKQANGPIAHPPPLCRAPKNSSRPACSFESTSCSLAPPPSLTTLMLPPGQFVITTLSSPHASACAFEFARSGYSERVNCDAFVSSYVSRWVVVPMNYNSTGGDDVDCSLNPTGDCSINVTAYAFMWQDRKSILTTDANWNPPRTRS
jgi:hypothetical protein